MDLEQTIAAIVLGVGGGLWALRERIQRKRLQRTVEPWDGETERRTPDGLSGRLIVDALEQDRADMPEHWREFVELRAEHKANGAISGPMLLLQHLEREVLEIKTGQRTNTRLLERLVGRLLPNEPLGQ